MKMRFQKLKKIKNYWVLTFEIDQLSPKYVGCNLRSNNYFFHQDLGDQLRDLFFIVSIIFYNYDYYFYACIMYNNKKEFNLDLKRQHVKITIFFIKMVEK